MHADFPRAPCPCRAEGPHGAPSNFSSQPWPLDMFSPGEEPRLPIKASITTSSPSLAAVPRKCLTLMCPAGTLQFPSGRRHGQAGHAVVACRERGNGLDQAPVTGTMVYMCGASSVNQSGSMVSTSRISYLQESFGAGAGVSVEW